MTTSTSVLAGLPAGIEGAVHAMTTTWENATVELTEAADPPFDDTAARFQKIKNKTPEIKYIFT